MFGGGESTKVAEGLVVGAHPTVTGGTQLTQRAKGERARSLKPKRRKHINFMRAFFASHHYRADCYVSNVTMCLQK